MNKILIYIFCMAITTYLIRMLPFVLFQKKITNIYVKSFMEYVPCVVLSCMTFPAIFTCTHNHVASFFGSMVAIFLGFHERSLIEVASLSVCVVLFILFITNS
ncbi:MAG: AzlD domain-containing protein [Traorella sp.]